MQQSIAILGVGRIAGGILEEELFSPLPDRPMHLAVFGSGSGTILRAMLFAQKKEERSPFAIRVLYTDRQCRFQKIAEEENLPLIYNPWNGEISREEYDRKGLESLLAFSKEQNCPIDFILFAGYMRLASSVWISAFPNRILNIHPADLTEIDAEGKRKFIGSSAVFLALQEGKRKTRTTAILIDASVDGGPIIASGPWVPYQGQDPITKEQASCHQEIQKMKSDWPVCLTALRLISKGRMRLFLGCVFLDGKLLPPSGYETPEEVQDVWNYWNPGN